MSTLKNAFKPTTSKSTSSKNPTYYNNEKNLFITDAAFDDDAAVRKFAAKNEHTPTKVLVAMLETEQDKQILRLVLMNDKMPRKAVTKFVNNDLVDVDDRRVEWFADDTELIAHFKQ